MTALETSTSGPASSPDASAQTKCRDPAGNVVLQASDDTRLFRIRDEDGLFDDVPGSVTENTRIILIDCVTSDELELLVSRPDIPFGTLRDIIDRLSALPPRDTNQALRTIAIRALSGLFPARIFPPCDCAEDALILALRLDLEEEIRKRLWYHVVTTREFHDDENESSTLPLELRTRCTSLLDSLISHFTALLFTPPATSHMACTDVFAESWMTVVISPSLESHGVYRPLESLEMMKKIDWGSMGVCQSCVTDKHEEWNEEADVVWKLLGEWLQE